MGNDENSRADDARDRLRYKIFLGVDIVGSTAFKQPFDASTTSALIASEERVYAWQRAIETFYDTARKTFQGEWADLQRALVGADHADVLQALLFGDAPRVWKTIGDEILFWKQIDHELQIVPLLAAWLSAIDAIRKEFGNDPKTKGLDVKATVWSAEFPFRNRATATGDEDGTDADASEQQLKIVDESPDAIIESHYNPQPGGPTGNVDFIGPGIDVGFRLSARSSSKKMAISLDVAYLLSCVGIWFEAAKSETADTIEFNDEITADKKHSISCNSSLIAQRVQVRDFIRNKLRYPKNFSGRSGDNFMESMKFHFSGSSELKGALGNLKYPFLWISTMSNATLDSYMDSLYIPAPGRKTLEWKRLYCFCQKFYDESSRFLHPPLISFDYTHTFSGEAARVENYQAMLKHIRDGRIQERAAAG